MARVMTLRTVLVLTVWVCWLVSAQGQDCTINWMCRRAPCSIEKIICSNDIIALSAEIEVEVKDKDSARYSCNRTTCTSISSTNCSVETRTTTVTESARYTTTQLVYPTIATCSTTANLLHMTTISPYSSPTTTKCKSVTDNSTLLVAAHGGYIAAILVLLVIIIILVILMGYLVKRTTPQRGTVQTTHQPLTDMPPAAASTAGDYCTPVALKQLQTSIGPANNSTEVYSEPVDTLSRTNSSTNRQSSPSCHFTRSLSYDVNPSYDGVALCNVNPSYSASNGYAVLEPQQRLSHPPLPDPPTAADDDSNTEYTKPVQMDTLPQLAENDYEVVKEIRKEKP